MDFIFDFGIVKWSYFTDENGMTVKSGMYYQRHVLWDNILLAGLSPKPDADPLGQADGAVPLLDALDSQLPGIKHVMPMAQKINTMSEILLISYQPKGKRRRLLTLNTGSSGETYDAFVAEMQHRLGDRWLTDKSDILTLRRRMGYSNRWVYPAAIILFTLILAGIAGYWYLNSEFSLVLSFISALCLAVWRVMKWRENPPRHTPLT